MTDQTDTTARLDNLEALVLKLGQRLEGVSSAKELEQLRTEVSDLKHLIENVGRNSMLAYKKADKAWRQYLTYQEPNIKPDELHDIVKELEPRVAKLELHSVPGASAVMDKVNQIIKADGDTPLKDPPVLPPGSK